MRMRIGIDRRSFFKLSAGLTTGIVALGRSRLAQAQTQIQSPATGMHTRPDVFFNDPDFNFNFLGMLGQAFYGAADVGACLAIAAAITDGDAASAYTALTDAGERLRSIAQRAESAGARASARDAYLQAANYTFTATYFVDGMGKPDAFTPTWERSRDSWDRAAASFDPPVEQVVIPYGNTTLPGYFFKADLSGAPRPLLLFNNGSDGSMLAAWTYGGAAALARGYNCLAFDGPGQGAALVRQKLYFRPDWEAVVTPVLEYALTRPEVDPARVALLGISQGGYWVPRTVAFEHRIAAAVADPGVVDVSTSWTRPLPPEMRSLLDSGQKDAFDQAILEGIPAKEAATLAFRMRPYGFSSPYDAYKAVQTYRLGDVVGQIQCPLLITDPEGEEFWPGQSEQLSNALPGPKALIPFTAAEGADLHCEPKALGLRALRIFDWLDGVFRQAAS